MLLVLSGLVIVYLALLVVAVVTDPAPARAARIHFGENVYFGVLLFSAVTAYFLMQRANVGRIRRVSSLAVWAFIVALLNPKLIQIVTHGHGFFRLASGNDTATWSLGFGALAFIVGIVAAIRIRLRRERLTGMRWAVFAFLIGGAWAAGWVILFVIFAIGMSGWR